MDLHEAHGTTVAIHSVVVSSGFRRQGIAKNLVQEFVRRLQAEPNQYRRVSLITHEELQPLYAAAGFKLLGPSAVVVRIPYRIVRFKAEVFV